MESRTLLCRFLRSVSGTVHAGKVLVVVVLVDMVFLS